MSDYIRNVLQTIIIVSGREWTTPMDDSSYRLNFNLGKKNEIYHHNYKEHLKISKITKFGREMLYSSAKFVVIFLYYALKK